MSANRSGKRILVLRYRFIGDTILTVPFLRNLRYAEPDAHIAWVVAPGSTDVVRDIPYVDEFIDWDPVTSFADCRGKHRTWADKYGFIQELRAQHFDKVYVLKRSFSSAVIAWLTGARARIGFNTEARGFLLTRRVPYRNDQHEVQNFLDVLRADGVPVLDDYLEAWLSDEEQAFAEQFFAANGIAAGEPVIGIHPFAANQSRAWHHDNFAEAANELQRRYGARIIVFGGRGDVELGQTLRERITPEPVLAVGTTSLRQTMAIIARCNVMLCNDSGIMHVTAALNTPLVALFGPQSPVKFGPWGKRCKVLYSAFPCSPCKQKFFEECSPSPRMKPQCMESISVQQVLDAVEQFEGVSSLERRA
ncbi:lipopolysaccharide heptosyltransferase II [Geomonas agri]|uniref:lipopolysaccharide heptosyltransferase II n=1 Tax=Geomonas agri TaxID=2873702 RepID=UPI001CD1D916|nr:lipopolysaccharide heptosyltransferase II [Geomonas agri]